ncbi:coniferyl-alcohol dehydrogenase [Actinomadura livida]|uniref:Coniferyl-alcohol dehydrogenase n=1 Tax=Actinomadura livida TaxID=79909 RepID=A0A7W7MYI2_9ACTN|nr:MULTISPECIES: coniferyl-alcohol dehydrogenase [Actinomadura]MBB4775926.1 NAD(P)-dependent dehydrogenase (short-subunit alcohol dehydrogenase family) [Actinomadura catellatispora]GGU16716.1 3-alpha-hydroxysteroid dehydrogenase [Actinomadura livida]
MTAEPFRLRDRTVVVTGAASGIGRSLAELLVAQGARVIGLDRREADVPGIDARLVDLADPASVRAAADGITGELHALFNVAGVSGTLPPETVVGINYAGTRELTEALLPRIPAGGAVVTTASIAGSRYLERRPLVEELLALDDRSAVTAWCREHRAEVGTGYTVSKDAVIWWTLHRAPELARRGVRINCVAPGITDTPILEASRASRGAAFLDAVPMPLGRPAEPREQAGVMAFLATPAASYLAGQVLWVDGGYSAGVATGELEHATGSVGSPPDETAR